MPPFANLDAKTAALVAKYEANKNQIDRLEDNWANGNERALTQLGNQQTQIAKQLAKMGVKDPDAAVQQVMQRNHPEHNSLRQTKT